jgi:hypothetical protein
MDRGRQWWSCLDLLPRGILLHVGAPAMRERWYEKQQDKWPVGLRIALRESPYSDQIPGPHNVQPHRSLSQKQSLRSPSLDLPRMSLLPIHYFFCLQWIINRNRAPVNPSTQSGLTLSGAVQTNLKRRTFVQAARLSLPKSHPEDLVPTNGSIRI